MVNVQEVLGFELPCHAYGWLLSYDNDYVKGQEQSLYLTLQSFQIMKWLVLLKWICILIINAYAFLN